MTATTTQARPTTFDTMPIGRQWRAGTSSRTTVDNDPWSGTDLTTLGSASAADVDEAFAVAVDAQPAWADATPRTRADVMLRAARILEERHDDTIWWLVHEAGATIVRAEIEWDIARSGLLEAAAMSHRSAGRILPSDIPGKENRVYRRPVGVVTVISPWNFPLHLSTRSVAPALALGNAVVLKPASDTPVCGGLLLADVLDHAGLPPGLLSVLVGEGSEIGDQVVTHPASRTISFTGSSAVGLGITRTAGIKRLGLELGGNGPLVVLDDADLDHAVDASVFGAFLHAGQICMRANRIIVDRHLRDDFVERFVERVRALRVGDPANPTTAIGPVINHRQLAAIRDKVERAVASGAELVVGGEPLGPAGLGLPPHVLLGTNDTATAHEEVFGPVITIVTADDEADASRLANATDYGLSSAVFTRDGERGLRFAHGIHAGMTHVNDSPLNDEPHLAFGGEKASGLGRFGGDWAITEFTTDHWISIQHSPRTFPI
jgi:aldehyde dehydrogenase (NAD+)